MTEPPKKPTLIVPEKEPEKPVIRQDHPSRSCATCDHSFFPLLGNDGGYCRVDPPKPSVFLVPPPVAGQPPRDMSISNWPVVYRHQFCGNAYKRKPELTQ